MILLISRRGNDCTMTAEDRLWEMSKFIKILCMEGISNIIMASKLFGRTSK
jgi:hypothetical protein